VNQGSDNGVLPTTTIHGDRAMSTVLKYLQVLISAYWLDLVIFSACALLVFDSPIVIMTKEFDH